MAIRPASRPGGKKQAEAARSNLAALISHYPNAGTAAEMAYAVLREAILSNVLTPGFRLRADDLAKELKVSKTPVREALRKLQAEDLIVSMGSALTVKVLTERQLLEIYYTREALEGMAARLAAENAGLLDLTSLRAILHDVETAHARSNIAELRRFHRRVPARRFQGQSQRLPLWPLELDSGKNPQLPDNDNNASGPRRGDCRVLSKLARDDRSPQSRRGRARGASQSATHAGASTKDHAQRAIERRRLKPTCRRTTGMKVE